SQKKFPERILHAARTAPSMHRTSRIMKSTCLVQWLVFSLYIFATLSSCHLCDMYGQYRRIGPISFAVRHQIFHAICPYSSAVHCSVYLYPGQELFLTVRVVFDSFHILQTVKGDSSLQGYLINAQIQSWPLRLHFFRKPALILSDILQYVFIL